MISREKALLWGFGIYAVMSLISMATMSIGAVVLGAALIYGFGGFGGAWRELRAEIKTPPTRWYLRVATFFTVACLLSLLAAKIWPVTYDGKFSEVHILSDMGKAWYFFWPIPLAAGLRKLGEGERRSVLRAWLIAFGVLSLMGIIQYFTGWPRPQEIPTNPGRFHAILFLGHHLSVASIFIFPFFAALDFILISFRRGRSLLPRWALIAFAIIGFMTLILTYSRTLWVALPIGLVAWAMLSLRPRVAVAAALVIVILAGAALQIPAVASRVYGQHGVLHRKDLWAANLDFFAARPLTGVGWRHNIELSGYYLMHKNPGTTDVFSGHAHDNFLDMLGGLGLLGAVAWVLWTLVTLLWLGPFLGEMNSESIFAKGLCAAWLVFQLNGLTQVNFWEAKVQHQVMWMVGWTLLWAGERGSRAKRKKA